MAVERAQVVSGFAILPQLRVSLPRSTDGSPSMLVTLLLMVQELPAVDAALNKYRALTSVEPGCKRGPQGDEVVICARRQADRYRVPLTTSYDGDKLPDKELARVLDTAPPPCGEGAFTVKCGAVGVSATMGAGRPARVSLRPLAP